MSKILQYTKTILAVVFGASPSALVAALALFGVHLDTDTVIAIVAGLSPILAGLGVALARRTGRSRSPLRQRRPPPRRR